MKDNFEKDILENVEGEPLDELQEIEKKKRKDKKKLVEMYDC